MWLTLTVVALVIAGAHRLTTRYVYGPRSTRVLLVTAAASVVLAYGVAARTFPGIKGVLRLVLAAGLGLPLFILAALVAVEILGRGKQRTYHDAVAALSRREQACLDSIGRIRETMQELVQRHRNAELSGGDLTARAERLNALVDRWQQAEGLARVRGLKVQEWREQLERLDPEGLSERKRCLEGELEGEADRERKEAVRVQLALLELQELGLPGSDPAEHLQLLDRRILELAQERRQLERELAEIRSEMRDWEGRRREFLAREIPLD